MKQTIRFAIILLSLFVTVPSFSEEIYYAAPTQLLHVTRQMQTPGFWAANHPYPDKLILSEDKIEQLNKETKKFIAFKNVPDKEAISGEVLRNEIQKTLDDFADKDLYRISGDKAENDYFKAIADNLNLSKIPAEVLPTLGYITHYTDQRALPTGDILMATSGDVNFDELQNSALNIGESVQVLHQSKDGYWLYVYGDLPGWVRKSEVAIDPRASYRQTEGKSLMVVSAKADVFFDNKLTQYYDTVQMGTQFRGTKEGNAYIVNVYVRDPKSEKGLVLPRRAYIRAEDLHEGFLPYTPRYVYLQAFKLLNAPYGWGGMYGEQDCSKFLQEIFATFGIQLPRNSSEQGKVGNLVVDFADKTSDEDKIIQLTKSIPGITLIKLNGHIMLYLGTIEGRPYAIHATWGYREQSKGEERTRVLNRVVVSDLTLGEDSKKGSLLRRIESLRMIKL
jgi:hypothetical protein